MKVLVALTASLILIASTGKVNYEIITDEAKIKSLIEDYDQNFEKLRCENSLLRLYKKEAQAFLECKEEAGSMIVDKAGERADCNAFLISIIESEYENGVDIKKAEVYYGENSTLVCLTLLNDQLIAFLKE